MVYLYESGTVVSGPAYGLRSLHSPHGYARTRRAFPSRRVAVAVLAGVVPAVPSRRALDALARYPAVAVPLSEGAEGSPESAASDAIRAEARALAARRARVERAVWRQGHRQEDTLFAYVGEGLIPRDLRPKPPMIAEVRRRWKMQPMHIAGPARPLP